jgi:TnpA family transposase
MPRRSLLSSTERESLLALPENQDELIRYYSFSDTDLAVINQHRGAANRLGFAVLLCYMRFPGRILELDETPPAPLLQLVASQLGISVENWTYYSRRPATRREHLLELQSVFGFKPFTSSDRPLVLQSLLPLALQTDKGVTLAAALIGSLHGRSILLPSINVVEQLCSEAVTDANRRIYRMLVEQLSSTQLKSLDDLLQLRATGRLTTVSWLRQPPGVPNAKHILIHIERLKVLEALNWPDGIERQIHQNRLLKLAREGGQMKAADLLKFESDRRYATLVAVALETKATVIDQIIELHDRMIGMLFNRAKHAHEQQFTQSGKAINAKVHLYWKVGRALVEAKETGSDPFAAIESVISWDAFAQSVTEAQELAKTDDFDYLGRIGDGYNQIRRYAPALLEALSLEAAPAAENILDALDALGVIYRKTGRQLPKDAPIGFVKKRWESLVFTEAGINRRFYELCALSELRNGLRSGDIWVHGSRQFKDFNEYLLPPATFTMLKENNELPIAAADCEQYLNERLQLLERQLTLVNRLAQDNKLPDASISSAGLKVTPPTNSVPGGAEALIQQTYGLLPRVKITELLMEVAEWTDFTQHFTHLKNGGVAKDISLLLTVVLADAINLGHAKMAEACPGTTSDKLDWIHAWHMRDETYSLALADLVNAQLHHPFARHWGDGTTASSDGQRFRTGSFGHSTGAINPKYGSGPGIQFYTHVSDQYSPFHSKVISVGVRDATYVLDGLLYHESDLRIAEHYTDTAGFTDHVFALMHLLGYRFAPRIRDLADKRLFVPGKAVCYPTLTLLLGDTINTKCIRTQWDEILRLATSIRRGTVTASLIIRKLGSYPRQNGLATALREVGRIERTLFTLAWLQDTELRRRVHVGLNKGEARNALARAVFFNRLGEIRDRSFEDQQYRASGLTLVTAAIVLWNTVYLERAVQALKERGQPVDEESLQHLSPLGWEHINLTGDYVWPNAMAIAKRKLRPLRV